MRKLISTILAAVMLMSTSAVLASAAEDESTGVTYNEKCREVYYFFMEICCYYDIIPTPGEVYISYVPGTQNAVYEDYKLSQELQSDAYLSKYGFEAAIEEMDALMEKTKEDVAKLFVDPSELEFLIEFCEKEQNIDNYYDEILWEDFQNIIQAAKDSLASEATNEEIDKAYWTLRDKYNELCSSNESAGDVNGDGIVNIRDVTEIQKYLVGMKDFNSSQKFVGAITTGNAYAMTIRDATEIQKYIVGMNENLSSESLNYLNTNKDNRRLSFFENNLYKRALREHKGFC